MHRTRGFTLVELMIVVVIIAILAAVVVPSVLSKLERRPTPPPPVLTLEPARLDGTPLTLQDVDLAVTASLAPYVYNLQVRTAYTASVRGTLIVRHDSDDRAHLRIAFPKGAQLARDVSLVFDAKDLEAPRYSERGIEWQGKLARGTTLKAQLSYTVQGEAKIVLPLDTHGRAERLHVDVRIDDLQAAWLPPDALPPTTIEPGHAVWDLKNVVNDRDVVIEPPPAQAPVARVILLCQLVGLAVLLFGAGFWYLSELEKPGRLDDFRWGHFLFLALTYSTFFIIFTVLAFDGGPPHGPMAIAAAVSYPLLMLHVSRSVNARFAFSRIFALAVFTQAVVVIGVYGGGARRYLLTAATAIVIALLTTTYRRFANGRDAYAKEQDAQQHATQRKAEVLAAIAAAEKPLLEAEQLQAEAERAASDAGSGALKTALIALHALADKIGGLRAEPIDDDARAAQLVRQATWLTGQAQTAIERVARELSDRSAVKVAPKSNSDEHCAACGEPSAASEFCPKCGKERPLAFQCGKCGAAYPIVVHMFDEKLRGQPLHCVKCGA